MGKRKEDFLLISASLHLSFFLSLCPLTCPSLSLPLPFLVFYILRQTQFVQSKGKKQRSDLSAPPSLSANFGVWLLQLTLNVLSVSHFPAAPSRFYSSFDALPNVTQADMCQAWAQSPKDGKIPLQGRKEL